MVVLQGVRGACFCLQVLCLYMCMIFQYDCSIWLLTKASLPKSVLISSSTSINLWPWGTTSRYFFRHASIGYIYIRIYISISMSISISISISISFYIYIYIILYHSISISISIYIYTVLSQWMAAIFGCLVPHPKLFPGIPLAVKIVRVEDKAKTGLKNCDWFWEFWEFCVMGSPSPKMLDVVSYLAPISSFFVLAHQQKSARSVLNLVKKKLARKPW